MNCPSPIDATVLADYWLAALSPAEEEPLEEHLFLCDSCCGRLRELIALAGGVREVARSGVLNLIVNDALLDRLRAGGVRIREYSVPAGGSVQCTIAAEDDLLIGRLIADLAGAGRVDLSLYDEQGNRQVHFADIPFSPASRNVAFQFSSTFAKAAPDGTLIARLTAVDAQGAEAPLGEYTFHHTRTIPGPPGW